MNKLTLITILYFFSSQFVYAVDIVVLGLFKNRAIIKVDGKQQILKKGKRTTKGLLLIFADSDVAVIDVDGKQQEFQLGRHVSTTFKKRKYAEAKIMPVNGMYSVTGFINGQTVDFLVDTGATWIAMNIHHARQLGIDIHSSSKQSYVATANGTVPIYRITLNKVRVGEIELRNVEAGVLIGNSPTKILLGNSFLNRVEMQRQGLVMLLKQKF